ncbi:MAG TPA: hypothetical protein VHX43_04735 [Xanthobacteraceae bacterium]|jgi:hypothetical protein|nr:hypothetical protein [Xanthobacteraceae bacterium]
MSDITVRLEDEEAILAYEVSDEAVEAAAASVRHGGVSATVAFCSGLDTCPA